MIPQAMPCRVARKTGANRAYNSQPYAANSCACVGTYRRDAFPEVPCLPPPASLPLGNFRHRLLVLVPFGRVIELRIAQGDLNRVMPHEFFQDLQWYTGIEQLCGEGM